MLTSVEGPLTAPAEAQPASKRTLRRRSVANLLRMGHCAPAIMKTLLDAHRTDAPWLVRLTAGLPGGIGNCRNECGGITAPLVLLGLGHARDPDLAGVPAVVCKGQALLESFQARHGTIACRDILGEARLPLRCVGVVRLASERALEIRRLDCAGQLPEGRRAAFARLHAHLDESGFHCAHAVLHRALAPQLVDQALLDATSGFAAGTAYAGLTCSALTAGVMGLGLSLGEIEDSRWRVARMIGTMAAGGDAFADRLNAFNRVMNLGHGLARWFVGQYGTTQCRDLTRCDLSTAEGVRKYVDGACVVRCQAVAREVAIQVRARVERARA